MYIDVLSKELTINIVKKVMDKKNQKVLVDIFLKDGLVAPDLIKPIFGFIKD
jgi:hypothetical protein